VNIVHNADGNVVITVSERNLRGLLAKLEGPSGCGAKWRRTESGHYLTIIAEPDHIHYAERPDAVERYGLARQPVGASSTPSSAASPDPAWAAEQAALDALGADLSAAARPSRAAWAAEQVSAAARPWGEAMPLADARDPEDDASYCGGCCGCSLDSDQS
jgi:hypothetical protein